jgi:hypothetical protein
LIITDGNLLPSKTELNFSKKAGFDLFTLTNFSFMDIALYNNMIPNVFAVVKRDLGKLEAVQGFSFYRNHFDFNNKFSITTKDQVIPHNKVNLTYDAIFDIIVSINIINNYI